MVHLYFPSRDAEIESETGTDTCKQNAHQDAHIQPSQASLEKLIYSQRVWALKEVSRKIKTAELSLEAHLKKVRP